MSKEEIIAAVHDGWRSFKAALEPLTAADMEEPGVCGEWSVKDIVGHIATWETLLTKRLLLDAEVESEPRPDVVDGFNRREVDRKRRMTVAQQMTELDQTHRALRKALADAPEVCFEFGGRMRSSIDSSTVLHYHEHALQIRAWLAKTANVG